MGPHVLVRQDAVNAGLAAHLLNTGLVQMMFSDIIIEVEGLQFHAHRLVLCQSNYLRDILIPSDGACAAVISIANPLLSAQAFQQVLRFMYGSPLAISDEQLVPLLKAASLLSLDSLLSACTDYLRNHCLSPESFQQCLAAVKTRSLSTSGYEQLHSALWMQLAREGHSSLRSVLSTLPVDELQLLLSDKSFWVPSEVERCFIALEMLLPAAQQPWDLETRPLPAPFTQVRWYASARYSRASQSSNSDCSTDSTISVESSPRGHARKEDLMKEALAEVLKAEHGVRLEFLDVLDLIKVEAQLKAAGMGEIVGCVAEAHRSKLLVHKWIVTRQKLPIDQHAAAAMGSLGALRPFPIYHCLKLEDVTSAKGSHVQEVFFAGSLWSLVAGKCSRHAHDFLFLALRRRAAGMDCDYSFRSAEINAKISLHCWDSEFRSCTNLEHRSTSGEEMWTCMPMLGWSTAVEIFQQHGCLKVAALVQLVMS